MMHELGHGLQEHDAMRCRSCGNEERASEGMPCESCSTFICLMCQLKGVSRCAACDGRPLPTGWEAPRTPVDHSVNTDSPAAVASSASSVVPATVARVTTEQPTAQTAHVADAKVDFDDEDQLIDYLFDQLTPPEDRPTP